MSRSGGKINQEEESEDEVSDAIYRGLYYTMSVAFQICKLLYDDEGKANDFLFLAVNPAHEKRSGLKKE